MAVCVSSAGCGRTGVICAVDYIYDLLVTKVRLLRPASQLKVSFRSTSAPCFRFQSHCFVTGVHKQNIVYRVSEQHIETVIFCHQQIREEFSIMKIVLDMRRQRQAAVQTQVELEGGVPDPGRAGGLFSAWLLVKEETGVWFDFWFNVQVLYSYLIIGTHSGSSVVEGMP